MILTSTIVRWSLIDFLGSGALPWWMFLTYRTWCPWLCMTCEVRVGVTVQLPSDSGDLPLKPGRHVMRKPRPRVELQLPVPGGCDDRLMASAATLGSPRAFGEFQPLPSASTSHAGPCVVCRLKSRVNGGGILSQWVMGWSVPQQ